MICNRFKICLIVIVVLLLTCYGRAGAQSFGYCVQQKSYEGEINISEKKFLGKKQLSAEYTIDLCYTGNNELVAKINRQFVKNDSEIKEKKLEKNLSKLFLENVDLNGDSEFSFKVKPPALVEDGCTYVLAPKENVKWKDKSIVITHLFRYEVSGASNRQELVCAIQIPDGSTVKEETPIVVKKAVPQKKQEVVRTVQKQPLIKEPEMEATNVQTYNCIDSLKFYYHRISGRYIQLTETPKPVGNELLRLKQAYEHDARLFEYFAENCDNRKAKSYRSEYIRVARQIEKLLMDAQENEYVTSSEETYSNSEEFEGENKDENKKNIRLKTESRAMRYFIMGIVGIAVLGFMFFKYGKKIFNKRR